MATDRTIPGGARTTAQTPFLRSSGAFRALGALVIGAALLATASCKTTGEDGLEKAAAKVRLVGPIWTCVQLGGKKIEIDPEPTVLFGADGRVSGSSGVNRYFGKFLRSENSKLSFSEVSSTRRAGSPEQMAVEVEFLKGLEGTTGFQVTGQGIQLLTGDKVVMELSAATDPDSWIPQPPDLEGPPGSMDGGVEWLKLTSGEWLKGEFKVLNRDSVEFESDEQIGRAHV